MAHKMRLPNGFGQITKVTGRNLRNPYRVMVSIGKTDTGRPITKVLKPKGYFKTYNEAYTALVLYNQNPYSLDADITMEELYKRWYPEYTKDSSESVKQKYAKAWKYSSIVHKMRVKDVRPIHIKQCMDEGFVIHNKNTVYASPVVKNEIKSFFNLILDYAVEYDLVDRNVARGLRAPKVSSKTKNPHQIFTDTEMEILWSNSSDPDVQIILIQCYSGWRPQELLLLKTEDIDIKNGVMTGGGKTEAGKDRTVPIHQKIKPFVESFCNQAEKEHRKTLIECISYRAWKYRFDDIMKKYNLSSEHRPHDGRKHFITMAKKYNVDEYAIKRIVGHTISDLTERVYTERSAEWLKEEMNKIS